MDRLQFGIGIFEMKNRRVRLCVFLENKSVCKITKYKVIYQLTFIFDLCFEKNSEPLRSSLFCVVLTYFTM